MITMNETEESWKESPIVIFAGVLVVYTVSHSIMVLFS
ncbi:hypothetical protein SAMN04515679_1143 [Pelosinus fermentans]|jgi:hypothetical protein|uniref:Uncharacterized protein n=1 Tax=Pelosinus fermentans B4 TaxID=1149862 RepID=I9LIA6_9FIRM|nr:hypothetical protein FB4_2558 [Pelosinus fermentans B4]OAM93068.1 hypothetical protein FR7_01084 [Pelosinus fermentans DSM 17108]SDQ65958.1 hypothetical protein SAMN04515679_1143 [Pelosinus fermentans]